jgi:acetolactate synthase-1/2/3 large subunit
VPNWRRARHLDADGPRRLPGLIREWLGMLGMHGTYEANMAMHGCDLMSASARASTTGHRAARRLRAPFQERSTSTSTRPRSTRSSASICRSSAIARERAGRAGRGLGASGRKTDSDRCPEWWAQIAEWRARKSLPIPKATRDHAAIRDERPVSADQGSGKDRIITTEVGQHQMWAAQHLGFDAPNRWMTSGGLGTMGYGLPAAIGVQMGHPDSAGHRHRRRRLDPDEHPGDGHRVQYRLPVKVFILNNEYMGMVRQWQELTA